MSIPQDLVPSIPALRALEIQGNPLRCDCNARWIQHEIRNASKASFILNQDKIICFEPSGLKGTRLSDVNKDLPSDCPPTLLQTFSSSYQLETGSTLRLECRAVSAAPSHLYWILSTGKVVNQTSNYSRLKLPHAGTLVIDHLKASDAGRYACVASSGAGSSRVSSMISIHDTHICLIPKVVSSNHVTVTWNATVSSSRYLILYRRIKDTSGSYGSIRIGPFLRAYTIQPLEAGTTYELCIGYEYRGDSHKLNCLEVETRPRRYRSERRRAVSLRLIIILITCLLASVAFLCIVASVINVCRQKGYEEPSYETRLASPSRQQNLKYQNYSATQRASSETRLDTMSQIPLDHLYPPSSTPLSTSTASLISNQHRL